MGDDVEGGGPVYPSLPRSFIEQGVIPFVVNVAGTAERLLEQATGSARRAPIACVAAAIGIGCLLAVAVGHRRA